LQRNRQITRKLADNRRLANAGTTPEENGLFGSEQGAQGAGYS
jgi:hypothetical protein